MSDSDSDSSLQARVVAQVIKMPRNPTKARGGRAAAAAPTTAPMAQPETPEPAAPAPEAAPEPPVIDRKAILAAARALKAVLKQAAAAEKAFAALRNKEETAALREKVEAAEKVKHVAMIRRDIRAASRITGSEASGPTRGP
jgi:hypothetical protein